ncbi:CAP domain-containing protein [Niabella sp. CC-SYL272]|uniref:CAP domain-containing protein n=1 Tax=Niabella agricola TaxID=2891571 RepID=UPI001F3B29D7|nr:CAP domain-containing protein [Niabella agricola]MCF3109129.1 CAP domain-containing protein [Niabella agricola]
MNRIASFALILCVAVMACSSSKQPRFAGDNKSPVGRSLLQQINAVRAKGCNCGGRRYPAAPPLSWNNKLETAAEAHSNYMQRSGQLTHRGRNGMMPEKRVSASGYPWSYVAENIAMGQQSNTEVIQSWLQSPQHCRNMMSRNVTEIGAARAGTYWTLILAAPANR